MTFTRTARFLSLLRAFSFLFASTPFVAWADETKEPPPHPDAGATRPEPPGAPLHLEANDGDIAFHVRTGRSEISGVTLGRHGAGPVYATAFNYDTLCTAPCTTSLPVGSYQLGLTQGDGHVVESGQPVAITGPGTLSGTYTSRAGTRLALSLSGLAIAVAGFAVTWWGFTKDQECDPPLFPGAKPMCHPQPDVGVMVAGSAASVVGGVLGAAGQFLPDSVEIRFLPGVVGAVPTREGAYPPAGLTMEARF
jgi:hypothetical protein